MSSYNHVVLMGNLTRDPEVKFLQSGSAVVDIGLAVNDKVKKANEWVDEVTFIDCTAFGKTAENVGQFLKKGSQCLVDGRIKMDQWQDKNTGEKRSKLKVIAERVVFTGSKGGVERSPSKPDQYQQPVSATSGGGEGGSMEDVPFAPHLI